MGGLVVSSRTRCEEVRTVAKLAGGTLGPFDAWLILRGLKTLTLRMQRQCENALKLAQWLETHPRVAKVIYPGLPSHPHHALAKSLLNEGLFGAMVDCELKDGSCEQVMRFMDNLNLCLAATTLGDVYTEVLYPPMSSHRWLSSEERQRIGIGDSFVRISVGIEAVEDIFHYAYAVFHSPPYRTRYAEFLKIDFPRLPLTSSLELFRALAGLGSELIVLHLMESPKLNQHITKFVGRGDNEVGNEMMNDLRRAHFTHARRLIEKHGGHEIKTIGDSLMVAFRTAVDALNFVLTLHADTGHERIKIRAGIHVGLIHIEEDDAFGTMVNFTARVESQAKGDEIWVSDRVKTDVDEEKANAHKLLEWIEHPNCELKGFPGTHKLWSVVAPQ